MIAQQFINLIYGSIVSEVIDTCQNMTEANQRLQKIGQRIGIKIIDQFMKDYGKPCTKIQQLVQKFATVGVKRFLGNAECKYEEYKRIEKGFVFKLKISNNPLLKNVQVLGQLKTGGFTYQSLIKGCLIGAFQVLKFKAEVILIYQSLRNDKNESIFFIEATHL